MGLEYFKAGAWCFKEQQILKQVKTLFPKQWACEWIEYHLVVKVPLICIIFVGRSGLLCVESTGIQPGKLLLQFWYLLLINIQIYYPKFQHILNTHPHTTTYHTPHTTHTSHTKSTGDDCTLLYLITSAWFGKKVPERVAAFLWYFSVHGLTSW